MQILYDSDVVGDFTPFIPFFIQLSETKMFIMFIFMFIIKVKIEILIIAFKTLKIDLLLASRYWIFRSTVEGK